MHTATTLNRYHGALLGLACGDALGTTLEFRDRGTFTPIEDMIGGGPFDLEAGEWTDDTSMAMCLAESLVERGFDPLDQMQRYVRWWQKGYWSSNGRCFDIGGTVSAALHRFQTTGEPMAGTTNTRNAPNGSLMRLAPVPLRFAGKPSEAVWLAAESSKTTHGAREAVDACRYFAALLVGAVQGRDKRELLSPAYAPEGVGWSAEPLAPAIAAIAAGSFKTKSERQIRATGYVVHTLEASLWAFFRSSDFREGALLAVNLGEDADTTGAVYGQLAGAYYGVDAIPAEWRERIVRRDEILRLATRLFELAWSDRATGKPKQTVASRLVPRDVASRLGHETLGILRTGRYRAPSGRQVEVLAAHRASRDRTTEYPPDLALPAPASRGTTTGITVVNETVLVAGRRMAAEGPVAALNFASAMVPGGGFLTGARAQEESIARSSGLVYTLEGRGMYDFHRERSDALYSDYAIYSPDVRCSGSTMGNCSTNRGR
jgi:ADP-ribosylglycohydrolase